MDADAIATRWKAEYGPKKARTMAAAMLRQARNSGERETVIDAWKDVLANIGGNVSCRGR